MAQAFCKSVQEMAMNGQELPDRYICKDRENKTVNNISSSVPIIDVPVIDIGLLKSSSLPAGEEELRKLRSSLSSWGCFQAINHEITEELLDKVRKVAREFFELPVEEKQKCSRATDDVEGYGNDMVLSEHQTLDWTDWLYLKLTSEDEQKLSYWPQYPEDIRETIQEYKDSLREITAIILKAAARSLNLAEESFLEQYGERGIMYARFNYYPPCPRPDLVLGLTAHADGSAITILLQDEQVEGLQLRKDDEWFRVPIITHALLVNVGDQMEIMSNGVFKSPMHRAVTNSEKERITVAVFCTPESDREIESVKELINEETPKLYKDVKNYADSYFQYYQHGKRPIDAVKF